MLPKTGHSRLLKTTSCVSFISPLWNEGGEHGTYETKGQDHTHCMLRIHHGDRYIENAPAYFLVCIERTRALMTVSFTRAHLQAYSGSPHVPFSMYLPQEPVTLDPSQERTF